MKISSITSLVKRLFASFETDNTALFDDSGAISFEKAESESLNFSNQQSKVESQIIGAMTDHLIAYAGANHVLKCIREAMYKSKDDEAGSGDGESAGNVAGLLAFCDIHPDVIKLICDELSARMASIDEHSSKKAAERHLEILIPRSLMPSEERYESLPYLTEDRAADIRNAPIADGYNKVKLFAFRRDESSDTLGNISKITNDQLISAVRENVFEFMGAFASEYERPAYSKRKGADPLNNVLLLLTQAADINVNIYKLSKYVATVWYNMNKSNTDEALRHALGKSLYVLSIPSQEFLFCTADLDDASRTKYRKVIEAVIKNQSSLRTCSDKKGNRLDYDVLLDNYLTRLVNNDDDASTNDAAGAANSGAASTATGRAGKGSAASAADAAATASAGADASANADAAGAAHGVQLTTLEHALIKRYLVRVKDYQPEEYIKDFNALCRIEWDNKLCKLFEDSSKQKVKKNLWERTEEHFKNNKQNESEVISNEDRDELSLIINRVGLSGNAAVDLSEEESEKLYTFVRNNIRIFNEDKKLLKEWNDLIFSNNKYEDDNFMLSLTKCVLNACGCASMQEDGNGQGSDVSTSYIELRLDETDNAMFEKNYAAAAYFSMRFGAYLQLLEKQLPFKFFVTGPNRLLPLEYAGNEKAYARALGAGIPARELSPALNYDKFYAKNNSEGNAEANTKVNKDSINFKFVLLHKSTMKGPASKYKLTWTYNVNKTPLNLAANLKECLSLSQSELEHPESGLNLDEKSFVLGRYKQQLYTITGEQAPLALNVAESFVKSPKGAITFSSNTTDHTLSKRIESILDYTRKFITTLPADALISPEATMNAAGTTASAAITAGSASAASSSAHGGAAGAPGAALAAAGAAATSTAIAATATAASTAAAASAAGAGVAEVVGLKAKLELIAQCYKRFHDSYFVALKAMYDCELLYSQASALSDSYTLLQTAIIGAMDDEHATDELIDKLKELLSLVLQIGYAYEEHSSENVIASPFTVESMRSYTAKLERLSSLICAAVNGELNISQIHMFVDALERDMEYIDAPEICLSRDSANNESVLFAKQEVAGYALYERVRELYSKNQIVLPVHDYTSAVLDYLTRYISTRPYMPAQCTLMIKECSFPDIVVGIYEALKVEKKLEHIQLSLLIVNDDMEMTAAISKRFEQLRTNATTSSDNDESDAKRIRVTILTSKNGLRAAAASSYSNYLDHHYLKLDQSSMNRIADLSILLHVFDQRSALKYEAFPVPVLSDEINILPSLVNRNNTTKSKSEQVGKFLVNQIQPLSRIQLFNSVWLCSNYSDEASNLASFQAYTKAIATQSRKRLNGQAIDEITLNAYLPYRIVTRNNAKRSLASMSNNLSAHGGAMASTNAGAAASAAAVSASAATAAGLGAYGAMGGMSALGSAGADLDDMLKSIHDHSEVVAFIDELQCRNLVKSDSRRLVYYSKLKNSRLNLLVSSSAERHNTERHLKRMFAETCPALASKSEAFLQAVENDALDISGSILLRAENRRKYTYELIGNVLSKFITEQILEHLQKSMQLDTISAVSKPLFLSIDDYQSVLTGKNTERADILCLHVLKYRNTSAVEPRSATSGYRATSSASIALSDAHSGFSAASSAGHAASSSSDSATATNGGNAATALNGAAFAAEAPVTGHSVGAPSPVSAATTAAHGKALCVTGAGNEYVLMVTVIESKFFQEFSKSAAKKSMTQALKSLKNLSMPFVSKFADRRQYLAKFADMLADNCKAKSASEYDDFAKIQNLIRQEQIDLMFMGYSFVFAHNKIHEDESDNDILTATLNPQSISPKEPQQVVQLRMQQASVRKLFTEYTASRCGLSAPAASAPADATAASAMHASTVSADSASAIGHDHDVVPTFGDNLLFDMDRATGSSSSSTLLERMLLQADMQPLNQYLTDKRPAIIKLHPDALYEIAQPLSAALTAAQALGLGSTASTAAADTATATAPSMTATAASTTANAAAASAPLTSGSQSNAVPANSTTASATDTARYSSATADTDKTTASNASAAQSASNAAPQAHSVNVQVEDIEPNSSSVASSRTAAVESHTTNTLATTATHTGNVSSQTAQEQAQSTTAYNANGSTSNSSSVAQSHEPGSDITASKPADLMSLMPDPQLFEGKEILDGKLPSSDNVASSASGVGTTPHAGSASTASSAVSTATGSAANTATQAVAPTSSDAQGAAAQGMVNNGLDTSPATNSTSADFSTGAASTGNSAAATAAAQPFADVAQDAQAASSTHDLQTGQTSSATQSSAAGQASAGGQTVPATQTSTTGYASAASSTAQAAESGTAMNYKPLPPGFVPYDYGLAANEVAAETADNKAKSVEDSKAAARQRMMEKFYEEHIQLKKYLDSCDASLDYSNPESLQQMDLFIECLLKKLGDASIEVRKKRLTTVGAYIELAKGTNLKTKAIWNLQEELLIEDGFRLTQVTAIPMAIAVRVEFSDDKRVFIPYEALLKDREFNYDTYTINGVEYLGFNSRFLLGVKDEDGAPLYLDLREHDPHTLLSGGTGSGKSTLLKMLLMDMCLTNLKSELKLILVDPKSGVELQDYSDLPNVGEENLIDPDRYHETFNGLVDEMNHRFDLFRDVRPFMKTAIGDATPKITDIDGYNKVMAQYLAANNGYRGGLPESFPTRLQHIILVIDEFAEIAAIEGKNSCVESLIKRLGNKARAAGIYLLLATQRATTDFVSGSIKSNTGNRICMKVNSSRDTAIALGDKCEYDGSKLSGKGHMIAKLSNHLALAQSGYLSDATFNAIHDAIIADFQGRLNTTK